MEKIPVETRANSKITLTFIFITAVLLGLFAFAYFLWQMEGASIFANSYLSQFATCF